jgi:hypothetical protein
MSASAETLQRDGAVALRHTPAWLWVGVGTFLLLIMNGSSLLNDSDTFWQIAVGQWILDHRTWPTADIYSFTKTGEPWISSSWLAQVLFAGAYKAAGWTGPVVLSALAAASATALLVATLSRRIPATYAIVITLLALALSTEHLLARPHLLALPLMMIWVIGLVSASDNRRAPSFWLLPVMALWANTHGGFVFGLALIAPFIWDALWNTDAPQREKAAYRWIAFAIGAAVAACATPYGWNSILAARKILSLGDLLNLISEWAPADFSKPSLLAACIIGGIAAVLYFGVRLSPPRALIVTGLLFMALSHVRNIEVFAFLTPLVVATPVARQFGLKADASLSTRLSLPPLLAVVAVIGVLTSTLAARATFSPPATQSPAVAVDALKQHGATRILNDLPFSGYLIWRGIPVFIDGRAELYGEQFGVTFYNALQLKTVDQFLDLLKTYRIDAVLLEPSVPAARLLDHLRGWKKIYADNSAIAFVRTADQP